MAEVRVIRSVGFTVMSNHHLRDRSLSLKAKGLLSYMLSLPDDWDYSIGGLSAMSKEGRCAVRAAINELELCGYLKRVQLRTSGNFAANEYIVYETPQMDLETEKTEDDPPLCENHTTVDNVPPLCGFPPTENPMTENRTQLSTKEPSTKELKPPKSPGGRRRVADGRASWKPDRFESFWGFYPRGESKQAAIRAWDKLKPDDALLAVMAQTLVTQMQREDWQRGVGIPYAATWLNQRRWEDEDKPGVAKSDKPSPRGYAESEEVAEW